MNFCGLSSGFSSILQIPGESTLRRNFQQIQEGEGRRTPNPFYQPPAPPKGAHNHRMHHTDEDSLGIFNNNDPRDLSSNLEYRPHYDGHRHHVPPHSEPHWDRMRHAESSQHHDVIHHVDSSRDDFSRPVAQGAQHKMHHNHHGQESTANQQKNRQSGSRTSPSSFASFV